MSEPLPAAGLLNWWDVHAGRPAEAPLVESQSSHLIVPRLSVA
jgi:hypothetical protein